MPQDTNARASSWSPPEIWISTEKALKAIGDGDGADEHFQSIMDKTFDKDDRPDERTMFLTWCFDNVMKTRQQNTYRRRGLMQSATFLSALQAVEWTSIRSSDSFHNYVYKDGNAYFGAHPTPMGQDQNFVYYLQPADADGLPEYDLEDNAIVHPTVVEMRPTTGPHSSPFKYGYCIGILKYRWLGSNKTPPKLSKTPFLVYIDIKSIARNVYIVLDTEYTDECGEELDLDEHTNAWEHLPSSQANRPTFLAYKICSLKDLSKQDATRPFFGDGGNGFRVLLRPWSVDQNVMIKELKDYLEEQRRVFGPRYVF